MSTKIVKKENFYGFELGVSPSNKLKSEVFSFVTILILDVYSHFVFETDTD